MSIIQILYSLLPLNTNNSKVFIHQGTKEQQAYNCQPTKSEKSYFAPNIPQLTPYYNIFPIVLFGFTLKFNCESNNNDTRQRFTHNTVKTALINIFKRIQNVCAYSISVACDFSSAAKVKKNPIEQFSQILNYHLIAEAC